MVLCLMRLVLMMLRCDSFTAQVPAAVPPTPGVIAPRPPLPSPAPSSAVIDVMELLDALKLKGLEEYEDAVADALLTLTDGVPITQVATIVRTAGVAAKKALDFATFIKSGEYKTAAAAASVVRVILPPLCTRAMPS